MQAHTLIKPFWSSQRSPKVKSLIFYWFPLVSQIFAFPKPHVGKVGLNLLRFNLQLARAPSLLSTDQCTLATAPSKPLHLRCSHNLPLKDFFHRDTWNYPLPSLLCGLSCPNQQTPLGNKSEALFKRLVQLLQWRYSAQVSLLLQTGRQAMGWRSIPTKMAIVFYTNSLTPLFCQIPNFKLHLYR